MKVYGFRTRNGALQVIRGRSHLSTLIRVSFYKNLCQRSIFFLLFIILIGFLTQFLVIFSPLMKVIFTRSFSIHENAHFIHYFSPSKFSVDLANVAEEWKIPSSQKEQMNSLGQ